MQIDQKSVNQTLIITPQDKRLDAAAAVTFKNTVCDCIESGNNQILINLEHIDFIDSSGLGAIVTCLKRMGIKGQISLCALSPAVKSVFELTRMNKVFAIHADESSALAAL